MVDEKGKNQSREKIAKFRILFSIDSFVVFFFFDLCINL